MKVLKAMFSALCMGLFLYLLWVFGTSTIDVSAWSEGVRWSWVVFSGPLMFITFAAVMSTGDVSEIFR